MATCLRQGLDKNLKASKNASARQSLIVGCVLVTSFCPRCVVDKCRRFLLDRNNLPKAIIKGRLYWLDKLVAFRAAQEARDLDKIEVLEPYIDNDHFIVSFAACVAALSFDT